jgi:GxxExxY protein
MPVWKHADLTGDIIDAFYTVARSLKYCRSYSIFNLAEAMKIELQKRNHRVGREVSVPRTYDHLSIGSDRIDLVVDQLVAIVVKNNVRITAVHYDKLRAYVADGGWPVGLLLNFGGEEPEVRRIDRREESN